MHNWWWGGYPLMFFAMWLFWALVIAGVVFLVRWLVAQSASASPATSAEPPRAILDRRLAAGEISVEEYDRLRQRLG